MNIVTDSLPPASSANQKENGTFPVNDTINEQATKSSKTYSSQPTQHQIPLPIQQSIGQAQFQAQQVPNPQQVPQPSQLKQPQVPQIHQQIPIQQVPQAQQQSFPVDVYTSGYVLEVGVHQVEIVKYLAEGGFAKIYVAKFLKYTNQMDLNKIQILKPGDLVCLKRVLVKDESGLNEMRNEVDVMKKLVGAPNVVQYYDSNASRRKDGVVGFEVLLLMEYCSNKSLLDYMNQRLATKLTENEILKIMFDVTLAVAQMHYLAVPLIHRDIKIENVLVDSQNNFKLCDFGSTSTCMAIASNHHDIALLTQNIYVHTTPQYRSPEMIDIYRCIQINEKSDIWALGIFLYKLLFFFTPFERTGQFAILHSKYEFPPHNYSIKLINLIIIMLSENPNLRPNIYQVLAYICKILNVEVPLEDRYGLGIYDFQRYSNYQTKLQNIQNQMYQVQVRKMQNQGLVNPTDELLLDSLFLQSFDVGAKIPVSLGFTAVPDTNRNNVNSTTNITTNNNISLTDKFNSEFPEIPNFNATHSGFTPNDTAPRTGESISSKMNINAANIPPELIDNINPKNFSNNNAVPVVADVNNVFTASEDTYKIVNVSGNNDDSVVKQADNIDDNYSNVNNTNEIDKDDDNNNTVLSGSENVSRSVSSVELNHKPHLSSNPFPKLSSSPTFKINPIDALSHAQFQQQQNLQEQFHLNVQGNVVSGGSNISFNSLNSNTIRYNNDYKNSTTMSIPSSSINVVNLKEIIEPTVQVTTEPEETINIPNINFSATNSNKVPPQKEFSKLILTEETELADDSKLQQNQTEQKVQHHAAIDDQPQNLKKNDQEQEIDQEAKSPETQETLLDLYSS